MSQFKPHHTLEQRLKQIRVMEILMYVFQLLFIGLAALQLTDIVNVLQSDFIAYAFCFVVVMQICIMKFIIMPVMKRKAQENLPE
ncbi:MAG: hypothetical protein ABJN69_08235 [Hellea sp.]